MNYQLIKGGFDTRHPHFVHFQRPQGVPNYLLLLIKTPALFTLQGETSEIPANQAILLAPNTPFGYQNPAGVFVNHWLHFNCSAGEPPMQVNHFQPLTEMTRIDHLMEELIWQFHYEQTSFRSANLNALLEVLLNRLAVQSQQQITGHPHQAALLALRINLLSDPAHLPAVETCAKSLAISVSYFQHLYKAVFGIAFQQDLIQLKINYAKELLRDSHASIKTIAETCGYTNDIHFHRQFKQLVGLTPKKYRTYLAEIAQKDE